MVVTFYRQVRPEASDGERGARTTKFLLHSLRIRYEYIRTSTLVQVHASGSDASRCTYSTTSYLRIGHTPICSLGTCITSMYLVVASRLLLIWQWLCLGTTRNTRQTRRCASWVAVTASASWPSSTERHVTAPSSPRRRHSSSCCAMRSVTRDCIVITRETSQFLVLRDEVSDTCHILLMCVVSGFS